MKPWIVAGLIAVLVFAVVGSRTLLRQDEAMSGRHEAGPNQAAANHDPVARGKAAYFKHCVACHSPDSNEYIAARPLKGYFDHPATKLSDGILFPRTDEAIRALVEKGTTKMPRLMKGMTPQELDDILAYMHTL
jgi:mono/diheme cytochrome c family protein